MPGDVDLKTLLSFRTPRDAILYLRQKGFDPAAWNWFDLAADGHARSFTVAKAGRLDVLQSIRNALVSGKIAGEGERDFVKRLTPELQKLGWWGKQIIVSPDGGAEVAQLGSPWRLRTIYRTNTFSAYNAARYRQQFADAQSRPYWQYLAVMDARTRPGHAALNGRVYRYDDPIWQSHYPPWAYNCRCRVRALTRGDLDRRGLAIESSAGHLRTIQQEAGVNKRTGEVITRPQTQWFETGPDGKTITATPQPGWGHNPALVPWQPDLDRYDYDIARFYIASTLKGPAFARTWNRVEHALDDWTRLRNGTWQHIDGTGDVLTSRELRLQLSADPQIVRGEEFGVAILAPDDTQLLDVVTQTVKLSDDSLLKQAISRAGEGFALDEYWRVQPTIETARVIARDTRDPARANIYAVYGNGDHLYLAVLKRVSADEVYLQSFRHAQPREIRVLLQRPGIQILKNE